MTPARYVLPRGTKDLRILESLEHGYTLARERPVLRRETCLDTFDWRLFKSSLSLAYGEGRLVLRRLGSGETVISAEAVSLPVFAADLPAGPLSDILAGVLGVRALAPLVETATEVKTIRVLDRREKTVARVEFERVRLVRAGVAAPFSRHLWLKPVTGYDKHFDELSRRLAEAGLKKTDEEIFVKLLESAGRHPGDYSSKLSFHLDPEMSAHDALVRIYGFLAGVMRKNEEGIKRDVDTEFLHDFRVATRRTRAGLGQLKKVFPKGVSKRFRDMFAEFGEMTNRLRDLDVYLMNVEEYRRLVPAEIRGDIEPLFEHVRVERAREHERVRSWLASEDYNGPLADWERTLGEPVDPSAVRANTEVAVIDLAGRAIHRRYESVVASGKDAAANPDDAKLHRLRIECKKLRYLLEFFSSLYPAETVAEFVGQLKALQDNLGRHQDIVIQQAGLRAFAEEFSSAGGEAAAAGLAVGALIGALETEKNELKSHFAEVFAGFASEESSRVFRALFGRRWRAKGRRAP